METASSEQTKNVQHSNALNAVLFEAIGLAIHLDTNSPLVSLAANLLARFILSKETNVRYLGLDTMAHLAARAESLEPIKRQQKTIILSLRDKDISVRRRALDLLYSMCDVDNAEVVVEELLRYLRVADYALREELVLKIAISTEKFATSYKWYVDTILQLISAAGDHVGDEVWYRVVQITTNTEDLQEYAAKAIFEHLRPPSAHESLVKIGGNAAQYIVYLILMAFRLHFGRIWSSHSERSGIQSISTIYYTTFQIPVLLGTHSCTSIIDIHQMGERFSRN
jgi:AP-2 complex subunit alpha